LSPPSPFNVDVDVVVDMDDINRWAGEAAEEQRSGGATPRREMSFVPVQVDVNVHVVVAA